MKNDIIISFVIPVFNQAEHIDEWLSIFEEYKEKDVEVVISDDGSTDNLDKIVDKYKDSRIKLLQHGKRLGQDRNILYGIDNAVGTYIWLFRTKDFVMPNKISEAIAMLKSDADIAYMTGSCIDETGQIVYSYENWNDSYEKGDSALDAHFHLYIHPSGSLYKRALIDVSRLDTFLCEKTDAFHFVYLCDIMRLSLSQKGKFVLIKDVNWIYTNTVKARTKSANNKKGDYIYEPKYNYMRLAAEFAWADRELTGRDKIYAFARIFGYYLMTVTWFYYTDTKNADHVRHYGIDFRNVDMDYERTIYLDIVEKLEEQYGIKNEDYYQKLKIIYLEKNMQYCEEVKKKYETSV